MSRSSDVSTVVRKGLYLRCYPRKGLKGGSKLCKHLAVCKDNLLGKNNSMCRGPGAGILLSFKEQPGQGAMVYRTRGREVVKGLEEVTESGADADKVGFFFFFKLLGDFNI